MLLAKLHFNLPTGAHLLLWNASCASCASNNGTRRGNSSFQFHLVFRIQSCVFSFGTHKSSWSGTQDTTLICGLNHGWNRTFVNVHLGSKQRRHIALMKIWQGQRVNSTFEFWASHGVGSSSINHVCCKLKVVHSLSTWSHGSWAKHSCDENLNCAPPLQSMWQIGQREHVKHPTALQNTKKQDFNNLRKHLLNILQSIVSGIKCEFSQSTWQHNLRAQLSTSCNDQCHAVKMFSLIRPSLFAKKGVAIFDTCKTNDQSHITSSNKMVGTCMHHERDGFEQWCMHQLWKSHSKAGRAHECINVCNAWNLHYTVLKFIWDIVSYVGPEPFATAAQCNMMSHHRGQVIEPELWGSGFKPCRICAEA